MPLVHPCSEPGCSTLTMGHLCIDHEARDEERPLQRRHRVAYAAAVGAVAGFAAAFAARARFSL